LSVNFINERKDRDSHDKITAENEHQRRKNLQSRETLSMSIEEVDVVRSG